MSVNHHVRNFRKLSDQLDISALQIIELCKIANISEEKWTSELEVRARLLHFFTYKLIPNLEVLTERAETDKFQTINTGTGFFGALTKKHEKEFGSLPAWPENISRETKKRLLEISLAEKISLGFSSKLPSTLYFDMFGSLPPVKSEDYYEQFLIVIAAIESKDELDPNEVLIK